MPRKGWGLHRRGNEAQRGSHRFVPSCSAIRGSCRAFRCLDENERIRLAWDAEGIEFEEENKGTISKDGLKDYMTPEIPAVIRRESEEKR